MRKKLKSRQIKSGVSARGIQNATDTILFLVVFGIGFLIILYFNTFRGELEHFDRWEFTLRIFLPCLVILIYAAMIWKIPIFALKSEQPGDNCYYLGFLFTLVSLAFALYDFVGADVGDRKLIIQEFGIALSTTIIGLLLRVLFSQARLDPIRLEIEAREALTKTSHEMRHELENSAVDFNRFRRSIEQSIRDALTERMVAMDELQAQISQQHENFSKEWMESVRKILDESVDLHSQINRQHQNAAKEWMESVRKIRDESGDLQAHISKQYEFVAEEWAQSVRTIREGSVELTAQLVLMTEKIASTVEAFVARISKESSDLAEHDSTIEQTKQSFQELNEKLSKLDKIIDSGLISNIDSFNQNLASAHSVLESNREPLSQAIDALKYTIDELNRLEPVFSQLSENLQDIRSNLPKPKTKRRWFKRK